MERRVFIRSMGLGVAGLAAAGCGKKGLTTRKGEKPNILFIMTDDHASHAISAYGSRINATPNIDRLAQEGMRFDNCFCTNSICAPSRAVILTGKHSHLNGVRDNAVHFDGSQQTFPKLLQAAGYQTAMIGKWHLKSDPTGFDYWNILPGQGAYYNPAMKEMGEQKIYEGYVTDIVTDIALDFLNNKRTPDRPFLMMLHHKAPHRNWQPALRHLKDYTNRTFPEPDNLFDDYATRSAAAKEQEMTVSDHLIVDTDLKMGDPPQRMTDEQKHAWMEVYGPIKEAFERDKPEGEALVRWKYQRYMQDYTGCIAAVDENIGRVLDHLKETGLDKNTLVVYTSDQGFYLGDHGWFDKRFMYEESLRMPLLVRWPMSTKAGSVNTDLVSNLDFAPTFLSLAGVDQPEDMQGLPMEKLFKGKRTDWRTAVYYHYYEYPAVHQVKRHYGVRTKRYKLMHFYHDIDAWELYDLEKDPREMTNVYDDPAYTDIIAELKTELEQLQRQYGDSPELARRMLEKDLADRLQSPF
ncbi:MAG: sulfatase [Candidatus Aminicenantes bacterium]|nr:sulfatase [Candidatus Aminicenantes bacterium]